MGQEVVISFCSIINKTKEKKMALHAKNPASPLPNPKGVTVNPCARVLPGSCDCQNQISKERCVFQTKSDKPETKCSGRAGAAGADIEKGKRFISIKKNAEHHPT